MIEDEQDSLWAGASDANGPGRPQGQALVVDIEGFEGPLDLLLELARTKKLDLTKISMLALAQQYLDFIENARQMRLDVMADYLVMAAWLAYLKSRLLLPAEELGEDEPTGEELAALLAFRLKRLDAMRKAAGNLMKRNRLGLDVFSRGMPEDVRVVRTSAWQADVYDLLSAYARQRQRTIKTSVKVRKRPVWSIQEARRRLQRFLGVAVDWAPMAQHLKAYLGNAEQGRTATASTFSASLELAREGLLEIRQAGAFAPLYIRTRSNS